jgi:hypothetical protein
VRLSGASKSVSLAAVMARLGPLSFAVLAGGLCRGTAMLFLFESLPTTRHPRYSPDDEHNGENGKNDHVEDGSVHHTLRFWEEKVPPPESVEGDGLSSLTLAGGTPPWAKVLAFVQSHGQSIVWRATC